MLSTILGPPAILERGGGRFTRGAEQLLGAPPGTGTAPRGPGRPHPITDSGMGRRAAGIKGWRKKGWEGAELRWRDEVGSVHGVLVGWCRQMWVLLPCAHLSGTVAPNAAFGEGKRGDNTAHSHSVQLGVNRREHPNPCDGDEGEETPPGVWVTRSARAMQPWGRCELFSCCHGQLCCHVQSTELQGLQAFPLTDSQGCSVVALLSISVFILIPIPIPIPIPSPIPCMDLNDTPKQAPRGDGRCSRR